MIAILIEDEPLVAKKLVNLLREVDDTIHVEAIIQSIEEAVEYFKASPKADVIFMDIQLGDGVSFDIFEKVNIDIPIIFTTAYNEYAIRAFKVNSIDYLLKPVDKAELAGSIEKLKRMSATAEASNATDLQKLIQQIVSPATTKIYKHRFMARHAGAQLVLNEDEIACFKKETLIYIVTNDKKEYVTDYQTMEELEELVDPRIFFRANRQTIVHLKSVESFKTDHYGKLLVKLKNIGGDTVDVSREKAASFRAWLG